MRPIDADELKRYLREEMNFFPAIVEKAIDRQITSDIETAYKLAEWERDIALAQLEEIGKDFAETMGDVKEAIEKQKPKKPIEGLYQNDSKWVMCPNCGSEVDYEHKPRFCDHCGQKLLWEEEEND